MELFKTKVGSHMWHMKGPESDIDLFECYIMDKRKFLIGKSPQNTCTHNNDVDIQRHEIYHVVSQLKKMNINYIWYLTSPIVLETTVWHRHLHKIFLHNPAKSIMYSIRGLVEDNMKRFKTPNQKKLNMWMRTIWLGINYLKYNDISYNPIYVSSIKDVNYSLQILIEEYKKSTLPKYPDPKPYDDFLYEIREALVNGKL